MNENCYPPGSGGHPQLPIAANARTYSRKPESNSNAPGKIAPRRILLPIDVAKCPLEVFPFVNEFAKTREATITLLHVLNGPVANEKFPMENARAAEKQLEQLARKFINPRVAFRTGVRVGLPSDAILAEAAQSSVDLIVLANYGNSSFRNRPIHSRIVQAVLDAAPCSVTLLPVRTSFNCAQQWEIVDEIVRALNYVGLLRPASMPA